MKTTKFKDYQNEIVELRRYFHAHPELSLKEYSTADYIEKYLNKNGIVTKRIGECGITARYTLWKSRCKSRSSAC